MSPNNDGASKLGRNPRTPGDYEIGYGRPPHEHQFKKGEPSRNSKGRPPGGSKPAPDLAGTLLEPVAIKMKGKERKVPFMEALLQVTKDKALRGDQRAAQTLINLMRELGLVRLKEEFRLPPIHIHFPKPGDKIHE
jgi:hypothetical protein